MVAYKISDVEKKFSPLNIDEAILKALNAHPNDREQAAAILGISKRTLARWMGNRFELVCQWSLVKPSVVSITSKE